MELPEFLKTQVREGKVVLVFGAGASQGATRRDRRPVPHSGAELGQLLSDRFLGGKYSSSPLNQISDYAISESSLTDVQEFIRSIYEPLEPAPFHRLVPKFRWHGLATTNYDRVIEKAYDGQKQRLQTIQPIISNGDSIQDALRSLDDVLLLKLHGCISRTSSDSCPLILTTEQYIQYKAGRSRLFSTLHDWAYERPLVFVGSSIQDPDLRALLFELVTLGDQRARCFGVVPDVDEVASRYWEARKLTLLMGTCQEFLETLHEVIPANVRVLSGLLRAQEAHPIAERFASSETVLSDTCRRFLGTDVEYVRSVASEQVNPRHFYRGFGTGWAAIEQNLDVHRKVADTILTDVVLSELAEPTDGMKIVLIKGHAGAGKSVLLRRIAWNATHDYQAVVLMAKLQGSLQAAAVREIITALDGRLFLFIDDAADRAPEVTALIRDVGVERRRLTILLAERINEWNIGGGGIDPYVNEQYTVPYLDIDEIKGLIDLLGRHRALGTLEQSSPEERVAAFDQRAGRQLLVALHEATLGRPFEDIIEDEYNNVVPAEAQEIYLSICVLNRLNVPVRAGVISRMHGVPFSYFEERFFRPLEHVVETSYDPLLKDHTYAARHPHIAEIAFQRALVDDEQRLDKYLRCLSALNIDYASDERAFRQMVRGSTLGELFPSREMVQHVFRAARESMGDEAYLLQQMALYEMKSHGGSLERAAELLDRAGQVAPYDGSIKHSRAELFLKLAEVARTPLEKEQRLRSAMQIASALSRERTERGGGSHAIHTVIKVGLSRLKDLLAEPEGVGTGDAVSAAIRSIEDGLLEGLQKFPDDSYLLSSEAELATLLKDSTRAIAAMRSAFQANPRNGVIAVRLAKSLENQGEVAEARNTLEAGLDGNPGDKRLHYAFAKFLMRHMPQGMEQIEYHLERAFAPGDRNYDAQLLYARQLYVRGEVGAAKERFRALEAARVGLEVRDKIRHPMDGWYGGRLARLEATYCFAARDGLADWVFAHRSQVKAGVWRRLEVGCRVQFRIGFTMKGPVACELKLENAAE